MQYELFIRIIVTCTVPLLGSPRSSDTQLLTLTLAKKNSEQREEQRYAQTHWKRWDSKYQKLERNRRGRGGISDAGCSAGTAVLFKKKKDEEEEARLGKEVDLMELRVAVAAWLKEWASNYGTARGGLRATGAHLLLIFFVWLISNHIAVRVYDYNI